MEFIDYYKVLGVEPSAELKQIKSAYRKLARKYHPDVSEHSEAEARFKEISEAYRVLKNPEQRAEFDEIRRYNIDGQKFKAPPGWQSQGVKDHGMAAEEFSEFFSSIFGRNFNEFSDDDIREFRGNYSSGVGTAQHRGQDVQTDLPVFLEDTLSSESQTISYHLAGQEKKLSVKIPQGVTDGELIRLKGQGMPGVGGGDNGDLYIRIRLVPHPLFDVEGRNLIITMPVAPWEAALGAKVEVPTLTGRVKLSIPPNSLDGQRLRIKGKGLINRAGLAGDLYAVIKIVVPAQWDENDRENLLKLARNSSFDAREEWRK